jgi:sugar phosphate isomerase/epimerase
MTATQTKPAGTGAKTALKISTSTYAYGHWDLDKALESIARVGYTGVEILTHGVRRPDGKGGQEMNYHLRPEWPDERINAVKQQLDKLDLTPNCVSPSSDFITPAHGSVQADIDEVCRHVDLAVKIGAPLVRPFAANRLPEGMTSDAAIKQISDALRTCGQYAQSKGVRIAVENHGEFPGVSEHMIAILKATDHPAIGLTLHIPRNNAEQLVEEVPDKIWHMHLGSPQTKHGREIRQLRSQGKSREEIASQLGIKVEEVPEGSLALGEGDTDYLAIVRAVQATGYTGWWNHEGGPEPNPEPTEQRSVSFLRRVLLQEG